MTASLAEGNWKQVGFSPQFQQGSFKSTGEVGGSELGHRELWEVRGWGLGHSGSVGAGVQGSLRVLGLGSRALWSLWGSDTYENLYLSPLRSFLEKTFCKLEERREKIM